MERSRVPSSVEGDFRRCFHSLASLRSSYISTRSSPQRCSQIDAVHGAMHVSLLGNPHAGRLRQMPSPSRLPSIPVRRTSVHPPGARNPASARIWIAASATAVMHRASRCAPQSRSSPEGRLRLSRARSAPTSMRRPAPCGLLPSAREADEPNT